MRQVEQPTSHAGSAKMLIRSASTHLFLIRSLARLGAVGKFLAIGMLWITAACTETPSAKADRAYDLADAAQTNARNGLVKIEELESQVSDLTSANRDLEIETDMLESRLQALRADFEEYKQDAVQWHHKHGQQ